MKNACDKRNEMTMQHENNNKNWRECTITRASLASFLSTLRSRYVTSTTTCEIDPWKSTFHKACNNVGLSWCVCHINLYPAASLLCPEQNKRGTWGGTPHLRLSGDGVMQKGGSKENKKRKKGQCKEERERKKIWARCKANRVFTSVVKPLWAACLITLMLLTIKAGLIFSQFAECSCTY